MERSRRVSPLREMFLMYSILWLGGLTLDWKRKLRVICIGIYFCLQNLIHLTLSTLISTALKREVFAFRCIWAVRWLLGPYAVRSRIRIPSGVTLLPYCLGIYHLI
jgi:hypothetical protein